MCRGSLPAQVVYAAEAPGLSEDTIGLPLIGPAGKLLDQLIERAELMAGVTPVKAFMNLVGCMPKDEDKRKRGEPLPAEIEACYPRLRRLLELCQPDLKLIVCVGELSRKEATIREWTTQYAPVVNIVHPAAILRAPVDRKGIATQRCLVALADAFMEYLT